MPRYIVTIDKTEYPFRVIHVQNFDPIIWDNLWANATETLNIYFSPTIKLECIDDKYIYSLTHELKNKYIYHQYTLT